MGSMAEIFEKGGQIEVFSARKKLGGCYGAYHVEISEEELEAMKSGKVLYFVINGGEYAIALTSKEKNVKVKFKYDD